VRIPTRTTLASLALLASVTFACAADMPLLRGPVGPADTPAARDGVYLAARGGLVGAGNINVDGGTVQAVTGIPMSRFDARYGNGAVFSGAAGWDFGEFLPGLGARVELEVGTFRTRLESVAFSGMMANAANFATHGFVVAAPNVSGRTSVLYGLANYYVDFNFGRFRPYLGAGLGVASASMRGNVNVAMSGVPNLSLGVINDTAVGLAWQVGAGLAFDLTQNITFEGGIRYLGVNDLNATTSGGVNTRVDLRSQQATAGMRVRF
jgi:opacity protein-like surface antigen